MALVREIFSGYVLFLRGDIGWTPRSPEQVGYIHQLNQCLNNDRSPLSDIQSFDLSVVLLKTHLNTAFY